MLASTRQCHNQKLPISLLTLSQFRRIEAYTETFLSGPAGFQCGMERTSLHNVKWSLGSHLWGTVNNTLHDMASTLDGGI